MTLKLLKTIQLLNSNLYKLHQLNKFNKLINQSYLINYNLVNRLSTSVNDPTDKNKSSKKDDQTTDELIENDEAKESTDVDDTKKKEKEKERVAINTYSHNPPGLMEFFDDPKNWGEDYIKSGRSWNIQELRIKSNSDLHKLWYVLLKERNMLLTMQHAYKKEGDVLPSEERLFKVGDSMKNIEDVIRERNKAYWQLEVDQSETGERPASFRKDVFGRYRWIPCSEHFVPMNMNYRWKLFNGVGTGRHVYEFMRRYKEKQASRKAGKLMNQAFEVRQLLRRFPNMDMEALQEKYPDIDVEAQKDRLDDDYTYRLIQSKYFSRYNYR